MAAFSRASAGGDLAALVAVLDPDVTLTSDGGGAVSTAHRPVHGADRVARFMIGVARKVRPGQRVAPIIVNGAPGLAVLQGEQITAVASLTVAGSCITRVDLILAPDKLPQLHISP